MKVNRQLLTEFLRYALIVFIVSVMILCAVITGINVDCLAVDAGKDYEMTPDINEWLNSAGYDLDGYQVSIAYHNYTKSIAGLYHGFIVTLDKKFLAETGRVENGVFYYCSLFDYLEELFTFKGYTVNVDAFNGQFQASVEFDSITDYYIANGIDGYEVSENSAEKSSSFLYNDYHSQSTTVFTAIEEEGNLLNAILNACYKVGAERDKILLNYVYGTPYKMIDTDADNKSYNSANRIYLHSYNMTMDETTRIINIYQHVPNSTGWYVLAVIIALPFIAIPVVFLMINFKKKEKTNKC